jgi:antitoxin component YwqK of YwqJK toxin-antitoxin module|tara:strand:- start:30 stop:605 length:576 start_codon:yes stop_codon:yes gene_type:complete
MIKKLIFCAVIGLPLFYLEQHGHLSGLTHELTKLKHQLLEVFSGLVSVEEHELVSRGGEKYRINSTEPFTGTVVSYHKNGQLSYKGTYKNGKKVGPFVSYHKNGQLWGKETYKDGERDGPYVSYHKNGQLWRKGTFKNGELDGPFVSYWNNGQLWGKGTYKNGKRDGLLVVYHENGKLKSKGTYRNGVKVD